MSETTERQLCRLHRHQERALEDWVSANIDRLRESRCTQQQAADEAAKVLGITLSAANIRGACKVMGFDWRVETVPASVEARLTALESAVKELRQGALFGVTAK